MLRNFTSVVHHLGSKSVANLPRTLLATTQYARISTTPHAAIATTPCVCIAKTGVMNKNSPRKSTWAKWPEDYFFEADGFLMEERNFDEVLGTKVRNHKRRRRIFKGLLGELIDKQRIVVKGAAKGHALARFMSLVIDTAKQGNEPLVYHWLTRKEHVPIVFDELVKRFDGPIGGTYTQVYRIPTQHWKQWDRSKRKYSDDIFSWHMHGDSVVELLGNNLTPLLPSEGELRGHVVEHWRQMKEKEIPVQGTIV